MVDPISAARAVGGGAVVTPFRGPACGYGPPPSLACLLHVTGYESGAGAIAVLAAIVGGGAGAAFFPAIVAVQVGAGFSLPFASGFLGSVVGGLLAAGVLRFLFGPVRRKRGWDRIRYAAQIRRAAWARRKSLIP